MVSACAEIVESIIDNLTNDILQLVPNVSEADKENLKARFENYGKPFDGIVFICKCLIWQKKQMYIEPQEYVIGT